MRFHDTQGEMMYGNIGEWRFDKRLYLNGPPPRNLSLPPPGVPESVVRYSLPIYFIFKDYLVKSMISPWYSIKRVNRDELVLTVKNQTTAATMK